MIEYQMEIRTVKEQDGARLGDVTETLEYREIGDFAALATACHTGREAEACNGVKVLHIKVARKGSDGQWHRFAVINLEQHA